MKPNDVLALRLYDEYTRGMYIDTDMIEALNSTSNFVALSNRQKEALKMAINRKYGGIKNV